MTREHVRAVCVWTAVLLTSVAGSACARSDGAVGGQEAGSQQAQATASGAAGVRAQLDAARSGYGSPLRGMRQSVQLTGATSLLGADHVASVLISPSGDVLVEARGQVGMVTCTTGEKAWMRDIGGETRYLHLGELDEALLLSLFVSGGWRDDPRLLFEEGAGTGTLGFSLTGSPMRGTITLDPDSHRLARAEFGAGGEMNVVECSGVLEWDGVRFPAMVRSTSSNGTATTMRFTAVGAAPTFIRSPFQPVFAYADVTFDSAKPATLELKRARTGHLLCRPTINGKQFDWFFFDTGAGGTILTPEVVDGLKLERFAQVPVSGIGGKLTSSFVRAGSIELGPVTMQDALATELDLSFVANAVGEKISGIIGFNLLSRCIAEVDQKGGAVSLYDPAAYRGGEAARGLAWSSLITYERHPCVEASFEDHTGWFKLDTGAAGSTVAVHAPAVKRFGLLDDREVTDTKVGGVGGMRSAKQGTLRWFDLGGHRTPDVKATFAVESVGALDDPYTLGNIGGDLMAPFVLVLDYQREQVAFRAR